MMKKRDLKADLERCARFGKLVEMGWYKPEAACTYESVREILDFAPAASEGWPHAIERAMRAEAEIEQLKGEIEQLFEIAFAHIPDVMRRHGYYVDANPEGDSEE